MKPHAIRGGIPPAPHRRPGERRGPDRVDRDRYIPCGGDIRTARRRDVEPARR